MNDRIDHLLHIWFGFNDQNDQDGSQCRRKETLCSVLGAGGGGVRRNVETVLSINLTSSS